MHSTTIFHNKMLQYGKNGLEILDGRRLRPVLPARFNSKDSLGRWLSDYDLAACHLPSQGLGEFEFD